MKKYDYIIIGGGSSGLVTASKLIKHGFNVLIIEEGQKNNNPILKMPAGWIPMLSGSPYHKFYKSIPQKQLNNRQHDIAQAKILGGGSSINGMVYMRGKPSDYKNWEIETADNLWGWGTLLKNYIKLESNQRIKNKFHGQEGPLKVSDPGFIAEGSNQLMFEQFNSMKRKYDTERIIFHRDFVDTLSEPELFDIILMHNTINHIGEDILTDINEDESAYNEYKSRLKTNSILLDPNEENNLIGTGEKIEENLWNELTALINTSD